MYYYGQGFCDNGNYAGWDGHGDESEEECKNLCLKESQCKFAAYYNGSKVVHNGRTRTCSRYNEVTCALKSSSDVPLSEEHKTFQKRKGNISR